MDGATLDQLEVFLTVAEEGSFSAAARRLRRAQSAVSYAVATLEGALDVRLFDRAGRTPVLTAAGTSLLQEARTIVVHAEHLHARAREIAGGTEAEVSIAVDVMFPMTVLLDILHRFRSQYPNVALRLYTEALGSVAELVETRRCQLGISTPLQRFPAVVDPQPLLRFPLVCVCSADHPLARAESPIPARVLQEHTQLVLTDRSSLTDGVDMGVVSGSSWRLADLQAKHELLRAGFGWGNMPGHQVARELKKGELVALETERLAGVELTLYLVRREAEWFGPAAQWLVQQLKESCNEFEHTEIKPGQTIADPSP
ncbi:MAG: LysR family transcriptional regulator [Myxococcota bacterium]